MRIRSIKPAFWEDAKVAALPVGARLFFIGLWNLADDVGYLRWDIPEVAAALYRYEHRGKRERLVGEYMAALQASGMVEVLPCGVHGLVRNLADHQHLASEAKRVRTMAVEHESCDAPPIPARARRSPPKPADRRGPRARAPGVGDSRGSPSEKEGVQGGVGGDPPLSTSSIPQPPPRPDVDALLERFPRVSIRQADMLAEVAQYEQRSLSDVLSGYQVVAGWIREAPRDTDPLEYVLAKGKRLRKEREAVSAEPTQPRHRSGPTQPEELGSVLGRVAGG